MHWRSRRRYDKMWLQEVWVAKQQAGVRGTPALAFTKAQLRFTSYFSGGPIKDEDNWQGGYKPVVDALVKLDILPDDTTEVITQKSLEQKRCKAGDERLVIEVIKDA